jgi:hypothetical protein
MSGLPSIATELRTSRIGSFVPISEVAARSGRDETAKTLRYETW